MKIHSSLLVLAAMVGSATAANKRKRVFKIYSREEIQAAEGTRYLKQGGDGANPEAVAAVSSMSMSMSMTLAPSASPIASPTSAAPSPAPAPTNHPTPQPSRSPTPNPSNPPSPAPTNKPTPQPYPSNVTASVPTAMSMETIGTSVPTAMSMTSMSMKTMCSFCGGKEIFDTTFELVQGQTCGTVQMATATMDATNPNCELAKQAESLCCPVEETTTAAPTTKKVTFAPAPTPPAFNPPTTLGAPSGAIIIETTLAMIAVAGAVLLM